MKPRVISLRLKLVGTTVFLAVLVVLVFAVLTLSSVNDYVQRETERVVQIRNASLSEVGTSTVRNLALPAASLMAEFDTVGLYSLVKPTVREQDRSYDVVYAFIIGMDSAQKQRVWMAFADTDIRELYLDDGPPLLRSRANEEPELPEPEREGLQAYAVETTTSSTVQREVVVAGDSRKSLEIQEFVSPIIDRTDTLQGHLVVGYSRAQIAAELESVRAEGEEKQAQLQQSIVLIGILSVALGVLIAILQGLGITRGILALTRVTRKIAEGDVHVRADIQSHDEIGQLGRDFNAMAERIQALLHETREKASLEKELDIARLIQETLMPSAKMHQRAGTRFCGFFRSASICGGDFWNYSTLHGQRLLLSVGDVTGHGVPSAMISAAAKSSLDTLKNVSHGKLELPELLHHLNASIYEAARRKFVMTFLAVALDPDRRKLHIANAGHSFPLLLRKNDQGVFQARALVARGNRLGDVRESLYEEKTFELQPDDVLFLYTDGITEYRNAQGKEYTERRLRRFLVKHAFREPDDLLERVLRDLAEFAGDAPQEDDITLVVARYHG